MNDKLYKEYENETEVAGQHTVAYLEWLEGKVLETSYNSDYAVPPTASPKLPSFEEIIDDMGYSLVYPMHEPIREEIKRFYNTLKKLGNFA